MITEFEFLRQIGIQQQLQTPTNDQLEKTINTTDNFADVYRIIEQLGEEYFKTSGSDTPDQVLDKEHEKAKWKHNKLLYWKRKNFSFFTAWGVSNATVDKQIDTYGKAVEQAKDAIDKAKVGKAATEEKKKELSAQTEEKRQQEEDQTEQLEQRGIDDAARKKEVDDAASANRQAEETHRRRQSELLEKTRNELKIKEIKAQAEAEVIRANAAALAGLTFADYEKKIAAARDLAAAKQDSNSRILECGLIVDIYEHAIKPTVLLTSGLTREYNNCNPAQQEAIGNKFFDLTDLPATVPGAKLFVYKEDNPLKGFELFYNPHGDEAGGERAFGKDLVLPRIVTDMSKLTPDHTENGIKFFNVELDNGEEVQVNENEVMAQAQSSAGYYIRASQAYEMKTKKLVNFKTSEWRDTWLGRFLKWLFGDNEDKVLRALDAWHSPQGFLDKAMVIYGLWREPDTKSHYFYEDKTLSTNSANIMTPQQILDAGNQVLGAMQPEKTNSEVIITKTEAENIRKAFNNNYDAVVKFGKVKKIEDWEEVTRKIFQIENDPAATVINYTEHAAQKALIDAMGVEQMNVEVDVPAVKKKGKVVTPATKKTQQTEGITFTAEEINKIRTAFNNDANYAKQLGSAYKIDGWDDIVDTLFDSNVTGKSIDFNKINDAATIDLLINAKEKLQKAGFVH